MLILRYMPGVLGGRSAALFGELPYLAAPAPEQRWGEERAPNKVTIAARTGNACVQGSTRRALGETNQNAA